MKFLSDLFYSFTAELERRKSLKYPKPAIMSAFRDRIVSVAKKEVGVTEINGTNCGPRVNVYKAATNLPADESWPWCAAFVDWVVAEAMSLGLAGGEKYTFRRPTTAGAWDLENWSLAQDNSTHTKRHPERDIIAGDIVTFTFSHVGIAISAPDHNGYVETIEGNTDASGSRDGGGVFRKHRHISKIRARIRFLVD